MIITNIYLYKKNDLITLIYTNYTPVTIKEIIDLNTFLYLEIEKDNTKILLDLSLLLLETNIGKITTWEEIYPLLTDVVIKSYTAKITNIGNPVDVLRAYYPLSDPSFVVSYLKMSVPEERNIKEFMYRLPDLAISRKDNTNKINFNNCLVSCNGVVNRPIVFADELLIKDGTRQLQSTTELIKPNVVLLDFTDFGGFTIVPLSQCTPKYLSRNNKIDYLADIELTLPANIDLTDKTIFPVLGGSLFFPKNIHVVTTNKVVISPSNLRLKASLLKQQSNTDEYLYHGYTFQCNETIKNYILNTMWEEDHYGAYLIVVNRTPLIVQEYDVNEFYQTTSDSLTKDGILFDYTLQSVCDFTKYENTTTMDIYQPGTSGILELDINTDDTVGAYAMEFTKCKHVDCCIDHRQQRLKLIRISGV